MKLWKKKKRYIESSLLTPKILTKLTNQLKLDVIIRTTKVIDDPDLDIFIIENAANEADNLIIEIHDNVYMKTVTRRKRYFSFENYTLNVNSVSEPRLKFISQSDKWNDLIELIKVRYNDLINIPDHNCVIQGTLKK